MMIVAAFGRKVVGMARSGELFTADISRIFAFEDAIGRPIRSQERRGVFGIVVAVVVGIDRWRVDGRRRAMMATFVERLS